ncbi:MAG TPA: TldD/PmbA family protein [Acidimicrobiia bacterium]
MIESAVLERVLGAALHSGGDFAEVFAEDRTSSTARYDDGRIEELTSGRDRGAGIRVIVGESTGYAHTADLSEAGLREAAAAAAGAARGGSGSPRTVALRERQDLRAHDIEIPSESVPTEKKLELLRQADDAARSTGGAIKSVSAAYAEGHRRILVANSDGLLATDDQTRTRFSVHSVASGDTGLQTGTEGPGRSMGFELYDEISVEDIARTSARRALTLLEAVPAPSGQLPVVMAKGAGSVLFHEACGHGLESDLVDRDASVFRNLVGTQVASPLVTVIDDGTYPREWGTFAIDDEGYPAHQNVLIDKGVLTDYMWDQVRARKHGRASSGNGRRETYRNLPMVRMTNTYLPQGESEPLDIIRDTEYGLYCVQLGGGQVDTATGDFVFGVTEGYLIEHGEITRPVRAAQLVGNGPETLRLVDAIANDFATWTGTCGKSGQGVPVSSGQPTLRVARMTVGGTAA